MAGELGLRRLPYVRDSLTFLYIDHARIEQNDLSIMAIDESGRTPIPVASLLTLLLGPGTTITHAAVKTATDNGCQIAWVGDGGTRFYAQGVGETHSARNLMRQVEQWADPARRLLVARRMYEHRFGQTLPADTTIEALRGHEGRRVRRAYDVAAKKAGLPQFRRANTKDGWATADAPNRALSMGNAYLYAICRAAILSLGLSPALGFIHQGHSLALAHDIADLYKIKIVLPLAFRIGGAESDDDEIGRQLRRALRRAFVDHDLVGRVAEDLVALLDLHEVLPTPARSALWDPDQGELPVGRNWGGT